MARGQVCDWVALDDALRNFAQNAQGVQSGGHIKQLHWYVACRLVIEGGFHPDSIKPRPPLEVQIRRGENLLVYNTQRASGSEATVFGGLKTKDIDVVVSLEGIGPCLAISMKGIGGAFRNLMNRLEEAVGDCTNIHIAYPALVYGFLMFVRANKEGPIPANGTHLLKPDDRTGGVKHADMALRSSGAPSEMIVNYHNAMARLAGRVDLRNDVSRYEAIGMLLVSAEDDSLGGRISEYPPSSSPLLFDNFFSTLYQQYDLRFVLGAPRLKRRTRRLVWSPSSPALQVCCAPEIRPRIGEPEADEEPEAEDEPAD